VTTNCGAGALQALPRPVGLVLAGGGVYGAAHVGALDALERRGFVPQLVVGTSVGALNGAIVASRPGSAASWLERMWSSVQRRQVFSPAPSRARGGLLTDRGLRRLIDSAGLPSRIEQLAAAFTAVALDLGTGEEVLLDRGDLPSALLASSAIPGVFPPVERGRRLLADAGPVAYVPVRAAERSGAASLVVITAGPEAWPLRAENPRRRPGAVAARAGLIGLHSQIERDLQDVSRRFPTVVLPTGVDSWPPPWDLSQTHRLMGTSSLVAGRFVDDLSIEGPGLYRAAGPARRPCGRLKLLTTAGRPS
jgi:NTE family protein